MIQGMTTSLPYPMTRGRIQVGDGRKAQKRAGCKCTKVLRPSRRSLTIAPPREDLQEVNRWPSEDSFISLPKERKELVEGMSFWQQPALAAELTPLLCTKRV